MKHLLLIFIVLFITCSEVPTEPEIPEATFTITDIVQPYYDALLEFGMVEIYYKIKNIGNVDIDYYKVWFEVTCIDNTKYTGWCNGVGVDTGKEMTGSMYIDTADKKYSTVLVLDYELSTY